MMLEIRPAHAGDGVAVEALLSAYLNESFPGHLGTSAVVLERDILSGASGLSILIAQREGGPIGFASWHRVYDLHWAKGGAEIVDLYVAPAHRGFGVALAMVAAVCSNAHREGLTYLRGTWFDRASPVGQLYDRIAVTAESAECHCAGQAFRRLAELNGQAPRSMLRQLPPKDWNYER
jgi:GNAT superfamily N-acetyltransferase